MSFGSLAPVPETNATLQAQQRQMVDGHRKAQLFPGGHGEIARPVGISRMKMPNGDVFHYRPDKVKREQLLTASRDGRENDVLGLGLYTKQEAVDRMWNGEYPVAVVERDKRGVEIRAAAGTHKTARAQLMAMHRDKTPGHTVKLEAPDHTIARRVQGAFGSLAPQNVPEVKS